jgi:hypothetical protein
LLLIRFLNFAVDKAKPIFFKLLMKSCWAKATLQFCPFSSQQQEIVHSKFPNVQPFVEENSYYCLVDKKKDATRVSDVSI